MGDIDSVRVAVRIRPLVKKEEDRGCQEIVNKITDEPQIEVKNSGSYRFNHVYNPYETQEIIYKTAVSGMLCKLFEGYNVTILAYGQTGSGKTHTMGTSFNGIQDSEMGVIPRAMFEIFENVEKMSDNHEFVITCSFMELYQEQLYDLLATCSREQSVIDIREDSNKGIIIPGLTEIVVTTAKQTTDCLIKGSLGRAVGATAMNEQSSRSHAIFTITIQMTRDQDSNTSTTSKFHLVDLAGSERSKKTKATGDRFKEGVKINQGLLALGNVISALGSGQGNGFIGYRDSKLTRLLQDSLGGNSVTLMIACVSPADYNMDETLSTLRYADRARKIKNKPIVNQDPKTAEINRLNAIIQKLRMELLNAGGKNINLDKSLYTNDEIVNMRKQLTICYDKNHKLQQQLQAAFQDVAENEMRVVVVETAHEKLQNKFDEIKLLVKDLNDNFNEKNCLPEYVEHAKKVDKIRFVIDEMDGIIRDNNREILNHKLSVSLVNSNLSSSDTTTEDMQLKLDAFTSKQIDFNNELRRINRELNLKEEHHQKVAGNLSNFCMYEGSNSEANIKESESKIQILEAEKSELVAKLKSMKDTASAKIAEDRRKRLQQLEVEINDLKKKNLQQSKLLKVREKESQKIVNLNYEIVSMKSAKVKLIRQMKAESESFRQWKLNREKQLTQLKEKDRKLKNEMVRMESLHCKQKNVLKRKFEEAMSNNKRLKEVLEKRTASQNSKKTAGIPACKLQQVIHMLDRELELIISVVDAQYSLDQLMEDRATINSRLKKIKKLEPENITEINTICDELDMRNAQIDDLQQKICSSDIEVKMKTICEGLHSLPEARVALKHLFTAISELRREYAAKDNKIEEIQSTYEQADEKIQNLEKIIENSENTYRENLSNVEKNYEEKITVLLRELTNVPHIVGDGSEITPEMNERLKIQQETLDKIDILREQVSKYQTLYNQLKNQKKMNKGKHVVKNLEKLMHNDVESDISESDDNEKDPDWSKRSELIYQRRTYNRRTTKNSSLDDKLKTDSSTFDDDTSYGKNSSLRCKCKLLFCDTRRCKCRGSNKACSDKCRCTDNCTNKKNSSSNEDEDEDANNLNENKENNDIKPNFSNFIPPASIENPQIMQTPVKKPKLSLTDEENKLDVTTPVYPFYSKKRKPFFD